MKNKFFAFLTAFVVAIFAFALPCVGQAKAASFSVNPDELKTWFGTEYDKMMFDDQSNVRFVDRTAGTEGEKEFALYLIDRMTEMGYAANGSDAENAAFESFEFVSKIDGLTYKSQNLMFRKPGATHKKKVILCASYDNAYGFAGSAVDALAIVGQDASVNSVLSVLSIANILMSANLNFDLEVMFFGAGYHNFAGSEFFTYGIDSDEANDILLVVNIDDLSEESLFYYDSEKSTKYGKFALDVFKSNSSIDIKKYKAGNSVVFDDNGLYPYSHRALYSDNVNFLKSGVRTISFLSVNKNGVLGNEYYIKSESKPFDGVNYPEFLERAAEVSGLVALVLADDGLESACVGNGKVSEFWTNEKWAVVAVMCLIVVFVVVYFVVFKKYYNDMKNKYSPAAAREALSKRLDEEFDKSDNDELKKYRSEVKEMFGEDLTKKINKEDGKKDDDNEQ